jgi:serine/threonine protein kinase
VAVKELHTQESFKREQGNLTKILRLNNRHLIKHFATIERGSSNYYVVFPLADGGSLSDYWERENSTPRTPELVLWSLQQMNGLAGALYSLHHELGGDEHCRHGDLKPANILLFEDNEDRTLVIADFGVSRIHGELTDLRQGGTTTAATTRSYEAPEASEYGRRNKPRARTYDIWSLGCVFLEFAIWLLYDIGAIKNFEENRKWPPGSQNASFFQMTPAGTAEISPDVLDAINALRQDLRCQRGTSLGCLVDLISTKLLLTVAEDRYNAKQLCVELQKIVQKGEEDLELFFNVTNQPRPNHKVFLQASRTWPRV